MVSSSGAPSPHAVDPPNTHTLSASSASELFVVRRNPSVVDVDEFAWVVPPVPNGVRLVDDALGRVELAEQRRHIVGGPVVCRRELPLVESAGHAVEDRRVEEAMVDRRRYAAQQIDSHDREDGQSQDGEGGLESFRVHGSGWVAPNDRGRVALYDKTRRPPYL